MTSDEAQKILRKECSWCNTPTDGKGPIREKEKEFTSHGICGECLKKYFPSTPHRLIHEAPG